MGYVLPCEFLCVFDCPSIASSPTDKRFAVFSSFLGDLASGVLLAKGFLGHYICSAINRLQGVDIGIWCQVQLILVLLASLLDKPGVLLHSGSRIASFLSVVAGSPFHWQTLG